MSINIRDVQNSSPELKVGGDIEFIPDTIEDETNAMIVGPSKRGPLFIPTEVRTQENFETIFGSPTTYSSYSAKEVLKQTDRVKFTRLAAADGWNPSPLVIFDEGGSDFPHFEAGNSDPLAILIFSDEYKRKTGAVPEQSRILKSTAGQNKTAQDFTLQIFDNLDNKVDEFRLSLNPFSPRYITKVLPPKIRIYQNFKESQRRVFADGNDTLISLTIFGENSTVNPLKFSTFDAPRTPWILSQELAGSRHKLFRVWVRSDGESENRRFKVSITDIGNRKSESGYPLFTLKLRDFKDTDFNQEIVEEFTDLSLNPNDSRFIGKAIGTKYKKYIQESETVKTFGNFEKKSLNIRIEISEELSKSSRETLPFGFGRYKQTFTESSQVPVYRGSDIQSKLVSYLNTGSVSENEVPPELHFGVNFQVTQNENFFQGNPLGSEKIGDQFRLDDFLDPENSDVKDRKFTLGFQGGSDGQSVYREKFKGSNISEKNTFGFDFRGKNSNGREAYKQAFKVIEQPSTGPDFDLLSTPELDVQTHPQTVRDAKTLVEKRGDALYVFDSFKRSDSPEKATRRRFPINSSNTVTYYGWVSPSTNEFEFVPPSAVIPQTYARSDQIADPWVSPAGPERGLVPNVDEVATRLGSNQVDKIYGNFTNVVRFSETEGIHLVGNRTYVPNIDSPTGKINTRRSLVYIISEAREVSQNYLFEKAIPKTAQNLRIDISDLLSTIRSRNGITNFRIEVNSPTERENPRRRPNTITSTISVIPKGASEFITVDFTISERVENSQ